MNLYFFIQRPIFAAVIAISIVIVGAFAYVGLPVSQFPDIVPPTILVTTTYPGASAETLADAVAAPLEQEINGVENMLYMSSQSRGDGALTITATFKLGTNLDAAQVLVQNRVSQALARLPEPVQRQGVVTKKSSPDILMSLGLVSPDRSLDVAYLSNYALLQLRDRLSRIEGVGEVRIIGARDYAMRIWIDPGRAAARGLTGGEIVSALRSQNVQVAAGAIGAPPTGRSDFQISVETQGRLVAPQQFADIVIKTDADGRQTRVSDVGRVELGAQDYSINSYSSADATAGIIVYALPGANALATATAIKKEMKALSVQFPKGMDYVISYNPTAFIESSTEAVKHTLFEAITLVIVVIIVFLQKWRAAIIPVTVIPVALVGTFAVLAAFGYSLNSLTLFALVLAIGIVVDDAIVVVENVERNIMLGMSPKEASRQTMAEVSTALVAIVLVLFAVFVPTVFLQGISGQFYRQFAITLSAATAISLTMSLTLSPALAALLLKPHSHATPTGWLAPLSKAADAFNRGFDRLSEGYGRLTRRSLERRKLMLLTYGALIAITVWLFGVTPSGFIPAQDQGYYIALIQLPPGSSIQRTDDLVRRVSARLLKVQGAESTFSLAGLDGSNETSSPNIATAFVISKPFEERAKMKVTDAAMLAELRKAASEFNEANIFLVPPPTVRGIGQGGFKMIIQDRSAAGLAKLEAVARQAIQEANLDPANAGVRTAYSSGAPRIYADIDRRKAEMLGVPAAKVFETLEVYLGSAFVNDFNLLGRTYRVTAQADQQFRRTPADIANLKTRSNSGQMVPIGAVATMEDRTGPYRIVRYNLYPSIEVEGQTAPGHSSGQTLDAMEKIAAKVLPAVFAFEWTDLAYQQRAVGNTATIVFIMSVVFVFLVLAAQYESLLLPASIVLIVPMCLLAAIVGVNIRGMDNNILTQIGLVVLIALAAKNAILIVEFARQAELEGLAPKDAVVRAAQMRLRPILMTSFAFILGVLPLVIAKGPGAELRQALGTAVFFGMIGVTGFGLLFTPTFYVLCRAISNRAAKRDVNAPMAVLPAE